MLTSIVIRNFKRIREAEIELGQNVVLIGPNNSGKTTVLQALALWELGLRKLSERRQGRKPQKRPGVTINRKDLISLPIPNTNLLWKDLRVRSFERNPDGTARKTQNVRVEVLVRGVSENGEWEYGLEFDYANSESFFCRPLLSSDSETKTRMTIPDQARNIRIAYLPPMSGLAATEPKLEMGRINVLIGEGQTAQVLRNLCFQIYVTDKEKWRALNERIERLFGIRLLNPEDLRERGEILMEYTEKSTGAVLDLSSSGRGLQQTLLLLAYLYSNPGTILLLDEPDAHLEILRQKQIYNLITSLALEQKSQVIAASHSEVILNEAGDQDIVVAFVGQPHRIDNNRKQQVLKSLRDYGFEHYYQAEQTGWVLYLEGSTDLKIIQEMAEKLNHPVRESLARPYVYYLNGNDPNRARTHFFALREAKNDFVGIALFDNLGGNRLQQHDSLQELMWNRREIENYICFPEAIYDYLESLGFLPRLEISTMRLLIEDNIPPAALRDRSHNWWITTKATDDFLDRVFRQFYQKVGKSQQFGKSDYHVLARFLTPDQIDPEVIEKLDAIYAVAQRARPADEV